MNKQQVDRRKFIGTLSASAAAMGLSMFTSPVEVAAKQTSSFTDPGDPDAWFRQIKGRHRIVFDATKPLPMPVMPFAWPRVFLMTNAATGTPEKECSVVMVIRHEVIAYALNNEIWQKYKLGEMFKINNPANQSLALRNPFWQPAPGTYKVPGVGEVNIGINELQDSGVLFCACDVALTVYSAVVAAQMNADPAAMKKEWEAGILPGIQIVPSGIWAVGRAQEHGCAYCQAG
jgi:intracellular sulfur oxidation DsrE/DsrF family protein